MATSNPVSQVLVTTGNQAPLAAGSRPDALAIGQIGIFNYHTGLSVDGTVPGDCRDVFFAVGIDPDATGSLTDINKSAGQMIQVRNAKSITAKAYIAPLPKIIEITGFAAKCESDYAIKIEYRNQKSYSVNGYNQFSKTYGYRTACCSEEDCTTCPQGDCNDLAIGIAANMNSDLDKLMTAVLFTNVIHATVATAPTADGTATFTLGVESFAVPILDADTAAEVAVKFAAFVNSQTTAGYVAGTPVGAVMSFYPKTPKTANSATFALVSAGGTGITISTITTGNTTVSDTAAFIAANPGACLAIRITGAADNSARFNGNIPLNYFAPRGTDMLVSLIEGFSCNGTVTTIQDLQYEEGEGLDIQYEEYMAGGWNGKPGPYRTLAVAGLQKENYQYFATKGAKYSLLTFTYDQMSVGGWEEYLNNLMTRIAIPCADSTTIQGLIAITDLIFTQFTPMTNDVAGFDCTNVPVHSINNPALDGIESLA